MHELSRKLSISKNKTKLFCINSPRIDFVTLSTGLDPQEEERLRVLHSLELLDSEHEERFDRICRLVTDLIGTPASYVSLIDKERQWFKATCGMGEAQETKRQDSLCDVTIQCCRPTLSLDTLADARFNKNVYVLGEPHVRFYFGIPLMVEGQAVGTLCAMGFEPRDDLNQRQMEQMNDLARIVETELILRDTLETQALLLEHRKDLTLKNAFIRQVLGRYVTDEVANHILSEPEHFHLGGQRREVTILMSDLRGFTVMSDRVDPEVVVRVLNHYLHFMVDVALKWGGTIDEIIGDALLIIFGAPLPLEDHAIRAVSCAVDMQQTMAQVNKRLHEESLPTISCGIGLNTGVVVVGNIGSERRMKYSVVGSPVNLTARIESLTIGGQILASESTRQALAERGTFEGKLRVNMKGFDRPITIYEIGGIDDQHVPDHA